MKLTILLISILLIGGLVGCSKPIEIECHNITNTIETIKEIKIPCNITCETSRELELIRRIKYLEGQQDKWIINETECIAHNKTEEDLENCENKIEMHERDIEELEEELDNCTEKLCEYNSTEC